jgi:hypothetical protein
MTGGSKGWACPVAETPVGGGIEQPLSHKKREKCLMVPIVL